MPFASVDGIPAELKEKLSPKQQRQWMEVFNSVFSSSDGDEGQAFRAANSAVKKGGHVPLTNIAQLPESVRARLDEKKQAAWLKTFNRAVANGATEDAAHKVANSFVKAEEVTWTREFEILAKVDDAQQVFGWFTVIEKAGKTVFDGEGDMISEAEMEHMSYDFVLTARNQGVMHQKSVGIGRLIASLPFTTLMQKALGIDLGFVGWFGGFQVDDDDTWNRIKKGELSAFSIGGTGLRTPIDDEE